VGEPLPVQGGGPSGQPFLIRRSAKSACRSGLGERRPRSAPGLRPRCTQAPAYVVLISSLSTRGSAGLSCRAAAVARRRRGGRAIFSNGAGSPRGCLSARYSGRSIFALR
jgi:hypothetical protein